MSGSAMRNPKVVAFQGGNEEVVNESSPLIRPGAAGDDGMYKMSSPIDDDYDWDGEEEETKSSLYLFLLTLGGLGLQIAWSVETSNGSVGDGLQPQSPNLPMLTCTSLTCFRLASASRCLPWYGSLAPCLECSCSLMWA
jgi:hypothetical protein